MAGEERRKGESQVTLWILACRATGNRHGVGSLEGEGGLSAFGCAGFSLWDQVGMAILYMTNRSEAQGAGFLGQAMGCADTKRKGKTWEGSG